NADAVAAGERFALQPVRRLDQELYRPSEREDKLGVMVEAELKLGVRRRQNTAEHRLQVAAHKQIGERPERISIRHGGGLVQAAEMHLARWPRPQLCFAGDLIRQDDFGRQEIAALPKRG